MRVLGIDPGLTRCGVGVVDGDVGRPLTLVDVGVVRTAADLPVARRLLAIEAGLEEWLERHRPDAVAVERVFSQHNVRTVMGTAHASGIALVVAARRGIPVALHMNSPLTAMVAVTLCAIGVCAALPTFWALPSNFLTGAAAAGGIALINSLGNVSGLAAPYITGVLRDLTGTQQAGMWVVGGVMVLAALLVVALRAAPRPSDD